jgi:hypothetical protein
MGQRSVTNEPATALPPERAKAVAGLFRGPALESLARTGRSSLWDETIRALPSFLRDTLSSTYDVFYAALRTSYRCEYLFKNTIAQQLLLQRHSMAEATLLTELRAAGCKADTVVLNGTSTVYEVKTGLDNLDRLAAQLSAYSRLFDRIYVVTEPNAVTRVIEAIPAHVGIIALDADCDVHEQRAASSNVANVSPDAIFDSLRVGEYSSILRDELGFVPDVPNGLRYTVCKAHFSTIAPERAHAGMVRVMKGRFNSRTASFVSALPDSLKAAGLTTRLAPSLQLRLLATLNEPYAA